MCTQEDRHEHDQTQHPDPHFADTVSGVFWEAAHLTPGIHRDTGVSPQCQPLAICRESEAEDAPVKLGLQCGQQLEVAHVVHMDDRLWALLNSAHSVVVHTCLHPWMLRLT